MAIRNLLRRKLRSLLTLIAIAIGVAAMVTLGALGAGLAAGYQSMAGGSQADLVLSQADAYDLTLSIVDEHIGNELLSMPEVRQVSGTIMGNVSVDEGAKYFFIFGHDPQGFAIEHYKVIEGENLAEARVRGKPLLLGKVAADALDLEVGDAMHLTGGTFRIVGIYETGDALEDGGAVIPLDQAQALLQKHRLVGAFYIKLRDTAMNERLAEKVERQYPNLTLATASEFGDKQQMVDYLKGTGWAVGALAIIVGGVGMTNTILMSVYERTREIGVFRAVGWSRRRVLLLIISESMTLALIGGAIGVALGAAIVLAIRDVPLFGFIHGQFSAGLFIQALAIALFLGFIGGLYPAWQASKLAPLEAMRYAGGGHQRNSKFNIKLGGMTFKNIFRQRTRTILTLTAIGIGIGAVVAMGGIFAGFTSQMTDMLGSTNAHLVAVEADISDFGYSAIDERVGARLAAHPDIAHVSGVVLGILTNVGEAPFFILFGYHPQEVAIAHYKVVEGSPLSANRQALLGRKASEMLGSEIGDTVRLGDSIFRVVGIFETGVGYEEMGAVVTRRDAQVATGKPRQVSLYSIELNDPGKANEVRDWLNDNMSEIDVSVTAEFAENLPDMESATAMMGGLAFLMALVGAIGMTNTILMSVMERTREIGVFRAVGWSRFRVLMMILKESLLLGALGGASGVLIGMLLTKLLALIPSISGLMAANFSISLILQALLIALFLGALGGIYPAWRATRMQPVEALRYE